MSYGARQSSPVRPQLLGYDKRIQCAAAYLFRAVAEHACEFAIDARHALVEIEHDDRLRRALEQLVEQSGLYRQLLFGSLAAVQVAQYQPDERDDAEAKQSRSHCAVYDLLMPGVEQSGLTYADADRERIPVHVVGCVDAFLPVRRTFQQFSGFVRLGDET